MPKPLFPSLASSSSCPLCLFALFLLPASSLSGQVNAVMSEHWTWNRPLGGSTGRLYKYNPCHRPAEREKEGSDPLIHVIPSPRRLHGGLMGINVTCIMVRKEKPLLAVLCLPFGCCHA
jgi:hypothetical protein